MCQRKQRGSEGDNADQSEVAAQRLTDFSDVNFIVRLGWMVDG